MFHLEEEGDDEEEEEEEEGEEADNERGGGAETENTHAYIHLRKKQTDDLRSIRPLGVTVKCPEVEDGVPHVPVLCPPSPSPVLCPRESLKQHYETFCLSSRLVNVSLMFRVNKEEVSVCDSVMKDSGVVFVCFGLLQKEKKKPGRKATDEASVGWKTRIFGLVESGCPPAGRTSSSRTDVLRQSVASNRRKQSVHVQTLESENALELKPNRTSSVYNPLTLIGSKCVFKGQRSRVDEA
ncbi:unnamed protein product [Pleuronectes platessa]|uniref:Uncharacterized protein n=1 Tax=Pleuronectes platessa TaxID=8262 RepID=A0A9N7YBF9_PLEPL|nr:unnamed protein product [Pleuronectes platessa]